MAWMVEDGGDIVLVTLTDRHVLDVDGNGPPTTGVTLRLTPIEAKSLAEDLNLAAEVG